MDKAIMAALAQRLQGAEAPQDPGMPQDQGMAQGMPMDPGMAPGGGQEPQPEGPMDSMQLALAREAVKNSLKQLRLQEMESGIAAQRQQGMADIEKEAAGLDKPKKYA